MKKTCLILTVAYLTAPTYGDVIEPLDIRSYSFGLNGDQYDFHLAFNRAPDFFTVDQFGRQAEAFDFKLNITSELPFHDVFDTDVLVWGGGIYLGGGIPIQNRSLPDDGSPAGHWGGTIGKASFLLDDNILTFSVDSSWIDPDGLVSYSLTVSSYGLIIRPVIFDQTPHVYPVPNSALLCLIGVACMGMSGRRFRLPGSAA